MPPVQFAKSRFISGLSKCSATEAGCFAAEHVTGNLAGKNLHVAYVEP